jgi:hypothetical protein
MKHHRRIHEGFFKTSHAESVEILKERRKGKETSNVEKEMIMVHAVKKGQLFESPISHLIVAGKRKEKRRMKDLRKMFHAPNFD